MRAVWLVTVLRVFKAFAGLCKPAEHCWSECPRQPAHTLSPSTGRTHKAQQESRTQRTAYIVRVMISLGAWVSRHREANRQTSHAGCGVYGGRQYLSESYCKATDNCGCVHADLKDNQAATEGQAVTVLGSLRRRRNVDSYSGRGGVGDGRRLALGDSDRAAEDMRAGAGLRP